MSVLLIVNLYEVARETGKRWCAQELGRRTRAIWTGSGLPEDNNPTSCVFRNWLCGSALSRHPCPSFYSQGGRVLHGNIRVGYKSPESRIYLYLPILQILTIIIYKMPWGTRMNVNQHINLYTACAKVHFCGVTESNRQKWTTSLVERQTSSFFLHY